MKSYQSRFSRKSRESRRYNTMRLFALSIRPLWHGLCLSTNIMTQGRTTFAALIAVGCILLFPNQVPAQQSTAPPSSLPTKPLAAESSESEIRPSCELCRQPDPRAENSIKPYRLRREKGLRPHKSPKGTHRSFDQSIKATLPRRHIAPQEGQGQGILRQEDLLSD